MSRSGYSEGCDDILALGRWRAQVASAIRGKRGQGFLRELVESLDAMPNKRLITNELRKDGEVCALGAVGIRRGVNLEGIDPEDSDVVGATFGIARQLACEIVFQNDEVRELETPEERWTRIHTWAKNQLKAVSE